MEFHHKPVLFHETIEALAIQPEGIYIDGTMGGGGHSEAILQRLTTGKLLSIDQDPDAMRAAGERLASYPQSIRVQGNFAQMRQLAESRGIQRANGVLLDIGVSSYQLDTPERGFSYHYDAPLDMRMSQEGPSAKDLVNSLSEEELCDSLSQVGLCAREYIDREVSASLSGGEIKRIEIATVLARHTKLSLFDEPEAGIDLWSFSMLIRRFEEIHKEKKECLILISHQERIIQMADKIMVIEDGQVKEYGTKEDVLPTLFQQKTGRMCGQEGGTC